MLPKILKPFKSHKQNLVRVGPKTDGGYILDKRIIGKTKTIITCGLNDDWEFEKSYLKLRPSTNIIAYDHTVDNNFWKNRFKKDFLALILFKKLSYRKIIDVFKFISYRSFFKDKNIHHIKKVVLNKKNKQQESINEILHNQRDIILKIDIEGDEYKILDTINKNSHKINFLIIEFHNIFSNINKIRKFLSKSIFKVIHLHGNNYGGIDKNSNPNVIELSLINSKKFKVNKDKSTYKYPIEGLDYKNLKRREDLKITFNE